MKSDPDLVTRLDGTARPIIAVHTCGRDPGAMPA